MKSFMVNAGAVVSAEVWGSHKILVKPMTSSNQIICLILYCLKLNQHTSSHYNVLIYCHVILFLPRKTPTAKQRQQKPLELYFGWHLSLWLGEALCLYDIFHSLFKAVKKNMTFKHIVSISRLRMEKPVKLKLFWFHDSPNLINLSTWLLPRKNTLTQHLLLTKPRLKQLETDTKPLMWRPTLLNHHWRLAPFRNARLAVHASFVCLSNVAWFSKTLATKLISLQLLRLPCLSGYHIIVAPFSTAHEAFRRCS